MDYVGINAIDSTYQDNLLDVKEEIGGIDLSINKPSYNSDYYVTFYLKRLDKDAGFTIKVNDYVTSRKRIHPFTKQVWISLR